MKKCKYCRKRNDDTATKCERCGLQFEDEVKQAEG